MKTAKEFRREKRDGHYYNVKRLAFGGEIHRDSAGFTAFDSSGRYLGIAADQEDAEFMAQNGFVSVTTFDGCSRLSLWALWEDARNSGDRVMQSDDGAQVLHLLDSCFMVVAREPHDWGIEVITDVELEERFYDSDHQCFRLKVCPDREVFELR